MSFAQVLKVAPLGFWAAAAHAGAVVAMSAGAVSFGQIVKAAEPVFAVIVGSLLYGKSESKAKIAMLVPIIVRCLRCVGHACCIDTIAGALVVVLVAPSD